MRLDKLKTLTAVFLTAAIIVIPASFAEEKVHLTFDHFYDHAELTQSLRQLEKAYPDFVTVKSLGKSHLGRDIWSVILNNPDTGPAEHKPGYYIDGNIHGNEIQGTEVALYTIWYLLKNYGETELATRLLNDRAFYVIPTMNPDSRDYFINKATDPNAPRSGLIPYDDDRDGTADEDPPEDLNGDGSITQMRKKDPRGNYKLHPQDPRILVPVQPGETGEYIMLGQEGVDNDGDGRINEDGLGGYDMNRNYGYNWQPHYVQMGSGPYPFSFPETKATRDFLLAHPNIMGAQNFHNVGAMILRGPGAKNLGEYPVQDRRVYDFIGKHGEKILPGYNYYIVYEDLYTVYGGSIDFIYNVLGAYTFSNELDMNLFGSMPFGQESGQDEDLQRMRMMERMLDEMTYYDWVLLGEQYSEWTSYQHPLYGEVEIGGVRKFGRRVPPFFQLPETCHRNAAFVMYHADQLPRLKWGPTAVKKLDNGMYQIDVTVSNNRVTPSISTQARQNKLHRADRIEVKGADLLAVGSLTDKFRGETAKVETHDNMFWVDSGVPGFGAVDFRLIVKGGSRVKLTYDSLKGGYLTTEIELK
jgi:hypothetical protein